MKLKIKGGGYKMIAAKPFASLRFENEVYSSFFDETPLLFLLHFQSVVMFLPLPNYKLRIINRCKGTSCLPLAAAA